MAKISFWVALNIAHCWKLRTRPSRPLFQATQSPMIWMMKHRLLMMKTHPKLFPIPKDPNHLHRPLQLLHLINKPLRASSREFSEL